MGSTYLKKGLRKNIETGVLIGLVCAITLSFAHFNAACDDLRSSVLRLHILANSDSDIDQSVKLAVRDEILAENSGLFDNCCNLEEAVAVEEQDTDKFKETADRVLSEHGFDYSSSVSIETAYFNTREYDDFTLPAGYYRSLTVRLGEARGHNWWCVVFPSVCLSAAAADLCDSASEESAQIAENAPKYVMKFKIVEWYETLKNRKK